MNLKHMSAETHFTSIANVLECFLQFVFDKNTRAISCYESFILQKGKTDIAFNCQKYSSLATKKKITEQKNKHTQQRANSAKSNNPDTLSK